MSAHRFPVQVQETDAPEMKLLKLYILEQEKLSFDALLVD
jgi:hypothetical protein